MRLNNLVRTNKKKLGQDEVLVQVKERRQVEVTKDKNLDLELPLKVLREDKCLYLGDYQKEGLNHCKKKILQF